MTRETSAFAVSKLECCPVVEPQPVCDTLSFRYRLLFRPQVGDERKQVVPVEVVLHFQLERCSGPLVLGDPVYTTTLLPGEQVRLFTSDRHARWSYDSESKMSYRHETTTEESFYTAAMARAMSELTISEEGEGSSSYEESWAEGGGGASVSLFGIVEIGGGGGGGSYDAESSYEFARSLSRHAESASMSAAAGVRAKNTTAVGEVDHRTHAEGESEAHYEAASRVFSNPNRCHAVTYLFHKINKIQTISFRLVAIEKLVQDPVAPTGAYQRVPVDTTGRVTVAPKVIAATDPKRLEVEAMALTSAVERRKAAAAGASLTEGELYRRVAMSTTHGVAVEPISVKMRKEALAAVERDLVAQKLVDPKTGKPTEHLVAELSWQRTELLPTPGIMVKGCLDECQTCEPALQKEMELDLERKRLENRLLERQIELLEKSQEYRCCPVWEEESEEPE